MDEYLKRLHPEDPVRIILARNPALSKASVKLLLRLTGNDIYKPLIEFASDGDLFANVAVFDQAMTSKVLNYELFHESTLILNEPPEDFVHPYFERYHRCATEVECVGSTFRKFRHISGNVLIIATENDVKEGLEWVNQPHSYLTMHYTLQQCRNFAVFNVFSPPKPVPFETRNVDSIINYLTRVLENPEPIIRALQTMILKPECDDPTVYYINDQHRSYIGVFISGFYNLYTTLPKERVVVGPKKDSPYDIVINTKECEENYDDVKALKIAEYYSSLLQENTTKPRGMKITPVTTKPMIRVRPNIVLWLETNMPENGVYNIQELYEMMVNTIGINVNFGSFRTDMHRFCRSNKVGPNRYNVNFQKILEKIRPKKR